VQRPVIRSNAVLALLGALLLFAINWYIAGRLAAIEYLHQMQSIEGAFIALSRFVGENWRDIGWFPWWYGGQPAQNAYFPSLPIMTAAFAGLTRSSPALGFHAVCAFLYCRSSGWRCAFPGCRGQASSPDSCIRSLLRRRC